MPLQADPHYTGDLETLPQTEYDNALATVRQPDDQAGFMVLPRR